MGIVRTSQFSASHRCDLQEANPPSAPRCFAVITAKFIEHQLTARRHPFCSSPVLNLSTLRSKKDRPSFAARPVLHLWAETPCVFAHQNHWAVTEKRQSHFLIDVLSKLHVSVAISDNYSRRETKWDDCKYWICLNSYSRLVITT